MDLDSMKYAELRSIAKQLGLKANMKAEKLLKAIKQHYQEEKKEDHGKEQREEVVAEEDEQVTQDGAQESPEEEEVSGSVVFVNTRRGKGNATKRKISESAPTSECDAPSASAAEVDPEDAGSRDIRSAKKRKESCEQTEPDSKEEAAVLVLTEKLPRVSRGGRIPRYQGNQQKNRPLKPVTPNFRKLHEAHFDKMESIDSYVQRKSKQAGGSKASVKELKNLPDKTKKHQADCKPPVKANLSRASMFSPAPPTDAAPEDGRGNKSAVKDAAPEDGRGNKSAVKDAAPFKPSVLSMRRINVRFSEATRDNEHKRSMVKTPSRTSPCVASSTPQKKAAEGGKTTVKTSALSVTKTPGAFVFTANTSASTTPATQKKAAFDLKASLSRPLSYKPHTGKLKPFGEVKENQEANQSVSCSSHQKNYKQHQVQTRGERRAKQAQDRKQKKESMLGARRGLVMM